MISTPSMDLAGSISLPSGEVMTPSLPMPNAMGMDGPVISASRMAVFLPLRFMLTAIMEVTRDFPTPPLPLTTPITFFTELAGFSASRNSLLSTVRLSQLALQEPQSWLHSLIFRSPSNSCLAVSVQRFQTLTISCTL